jgi:poly-gamma-glutamate system protein
METGGGLGGAGRALGLETIRRHGARHLPEAGPTGLVEDVDRRWGIFLADSPPKAFIDVGGDITSLGRAPEAATLGNGLLRDAPGTSSPNPGLAFKMLEAGIPVILMIDIERLAAKHHLPMIPTELKVDPGPSPARRRKTFWSRVALVVWLILSFWSHCGDLRKRREERFRL